MPEPPFYPSILRHRKIGERAKDLETTMEAMGGGKRWWHEAMKWYAMPTTRCTFLQGMGADKLSGATSDLLG